MWQLNSVLNRVSFFVRNTLWVVLLCGMPALHAQSESFSSNSDWSPDWSANWPEEMAQPIEISVHKAPLNIFMQALFANTRINPEISESLTSFVSGRFEGSILSVVDKLIIEHGLVARNDEGVFKILPAEQVLEESIVAPAQEDSTTQPVRVDRLVERVFVLKNATAIDTQLSDVNRTDVPGVASQLKTLVEKLGISTFTYVNAPVADSSNLSHSIVARPSMNAVVVKDLESRMALYIDLIESLDVVHEVNSLADSTMVLPQASSSTSSGVTSDVTSDDIAGVTSLQPSSKWTVVR